MALQNKKSEVEKLKAEIERLKKELKKRKKYGLVWEDKQEEVVEMCKEKLPVLKEVKNKEIITDKDKPVNLLIEGDNYHALSVLNYTHAGKVDIIYIDPPYNTGAKNWKYNNNYVDINDAFRHSKWLSMMEKRLMLAKKLLKSDGVLICAIDDNELARLIMLIEDIFTGYEINTVVVVHNPKGRQGTNFSNIHEYALFITPKGKKVVKNIEKQSWSNLRKGGKESERHTAQNCFYPIIINQKGNIVNFGNVLPPNLHPKEANEKKENLIYIWPIDAKGIERKWRYARQSIEATTLRAIKNKKGIWEIQIYKATALSKTVWYEPEYDASTYGTKILSNIIGPNKFDFPKSLYLVKDCIKIIDTNKNALILDFFAGSGTTGHAVLELNKEDGGNRQFILCTNNENNICTDVCYPRIKKVIEGYKNLKGEWVEGLSGNLKYFKTDFVDYDKPTDKNKIKLTKQATEMLCVKEGTFEKVMDNERFKIFKNSDHYTGIIWDQTAIPEFKEVIKNIKAKFSVYIFSLTDETFDEEFADIKQKVKLSPIPEAILRVYRRIFK